MEFDEVKATLPGWDVRKSKGGNWQAYSPAFKHDGVCILGRSPEQLIERVRISVQIVAIAAGIAGREMPSAPVLGAWRGEPSPELPAADVEPVHALGCVPVVLSKNAARRQAKEKGYEGDTCMECHAMTMVRNGSCLKCVSCGSTSGCS